MPFRAVKAPLDEGTIAILSTAADFQLPAYAIYKPLQATSDPALECLENSIVHVASSLEEARQVAGTRQPPRRLGSAIRSVSRDRVNDIHQRTFGDEELLLPHILFEYPIK
jgi:hypothetical protein